MVASRIGKQKDSSELGWCYMRKLKVYLDTSVISHLLQEDVPEKMADTRKLWEMFKDGKWGMSMIAEPVISSDFTIEDIHKIREYHYELTKDMTTQEKINFYNEGGRTFLKEMEERKLQKERHTGN